MSSYSARRIYIDWTDVYGRTLPGSIVLINVYALLMKTSLSDGVREFVYGLYGSSVALFGVAFVICSFILGYASLSINYYTYGRWIRRRGKRIEVIDPTVQGDLKQLMDARFGVDAVSNKRSLIHGWCKTALLKDHPDAFLRVEALQAQVSTRQGLLFAFIFTTITLAVYHHWICSVVAAVLAAVFLWEYRKSTWARDREAIWLYYHVKKEESKEESE